MGSRRWQRIEWLSPQLSQARDIDPRGTADLMRWLLQNSVRDDLLMEAFSRHFESADQFRAWFAELRERAAYGQ